ncbi:MAG: hypothetical protein U0325_25455 [Polyangiales bacterium]
MATLINPALALGRFAERASGLADERMSASLRRRLDEAAPFAVVELGEGVRGIKPSPESRELFRKRRLPVIAQGLATGLARATAAAAREPYTLHHGDADLTLLLEQTCFGRRIREDADGLVIDLTHHENLPMLPGFFTHGIKAHLTRSNGRLDVARIDIAGHTLTKGHPNWSLAKIHLIVGMDNETLFADHSVVHLHNNYLEAAAQRTLPAHNPLALFLQPHFGVTIPLNEWIFERFHKHASVGSPFGHPVASILKLVRKGLQADHAAGLSPRAVETPYARAQGHARAVMHDHVASFVRENLPEASPAFEQVRAFIDAARELIPYLPEGRALTRENLTEVITRFLYEATFVSAGDHVVNREVVGFYRSVFRLRQPFNPDARWQPQDLFSPLDTFQRVVFRDVFSGDVCFSRLADVSYDPRLRVDLEGLRRGLAGLEQRYPRLFPRDRIAASIDI